LAVLLQPDLSVVVTSRPRVERLRSVTATPFRVGAPFTAGTLFPYPVSGALYSEDGALVGLSLRVSGVGGDHAVLADPDAIDVSAPTERVPGHGCYLGHLFEHHGHFVTETLSSLWPLVDGETFDYFVFHPFGAAADLNGNATWALGQFGIERQALHVIRARTRFEELTIPERTWQPNQGVHLAYRDIAEKIGKPFWQEGRSRRIYLSRSRVANRLIENEPEIEEYFAARGYDVVHPETMPMNEQLAQFGSCNLLAGFSGSALHNVVFSPPGTALISLGDRRTRGTLLPNQRICNAISGCPMALVPFAEGGRGFDLSALREEVPAAEDLIAAAR
jgi:hypothetical protein